MKELEHHKAPLFHITPPAPCPYLENQTERKIFTHLSGENANTLNDALTHAGFRRSQNIIYKHSCDGCQACISVRVKVKDFQPNASFRRVLKKNQDLHATRIAPEAYREHFELLSTYLSSRHENGSMNDMNIFEYMAMVEDTNVDTHIVEYTSPSRELVSVCLIDRLSDGLSMVYSFFNPAMDKRSLGSFMILDQIQRTQEMGLNYLYLGYWIENCQKMVYKNRFKPMEKLTKTGWIPL